MSAIMSAATALSCSRANVLPHIPFDLVITGKAPGRHRCELRRTRRLSARRRARRCRSSASQPQKRRPLGPSPADAHGVSRPRRNVISRAYWFDGPEICRVTRSISHDPTHCRIIRHADLHTLDRTAQSCGYKADSPPRLNACRRAPSSEFVAHTWFSKPRQLASYPLARGYGLYGCHRLSH